MTIYINGHALNFDHDKNGVRLAECGCGAPIHKRMPNRRQPNITLEEFMREANVKHQQHLDNVDARENLMRAFKDSPAPKVDYAAMEANNPKPCPLNYTNDTQRRYETGSHQYAALNETTIYCTQCGDVQHLGRVSEEHTNNMERDNNNLIIENRDLRDRALKAETSALYWSSWHTVPDIKNEVEQHVANALAGVVIDSDTRKRYAHMLLEVIKNGLEVAHQKYPM